MTQRLDHSASDGLIALGRECISFSKQRHTMNTNKEKNRPSQRIFISAPVPLRRNHTLVMVNCKGGMGNGIMGAIESNDLLENSQESISNFINP